MSAKKSLPNRELATEALLYEDVALSRKYTVIEIAMLAAGCRGGTTADRIHDAVELLALVERYALAGRTTRLNIRNRNSEKKLGGSKTSGEHYAAVQNRFLKAVETCNTAVRDTNTGRIKLTSLVGLAYTEATGRKSVSSEAMRLFNEWLSYEAGEQSISVIEFKAQYVSGAKLAVVHSDYEALQLGMQFIEYLEKIPKREPNKIIQSDTTGQIVSPKTCGSERAEVGVSGKAKSGKPRKGGQFQPVQPNVMEELPFNLRGNRM